MSDGKRESWRLFCALALPEEVRTAAATHAARMREAFPRVRASWERPEKMHLTLKFVGEVERARAAELSTAAARSAGTTASFVLSVGGTGTFPPHGPPRVLWLGVEDASGGLALLHRRLEDECVAAGFPREARPFNPHLTLARVRAPRDARDLAAAHRETHFAPQTFTISELLVIRSELGPGGSRYTTVSQHQLQKEKQ
jgi:RNA 2',3'-cyclic 3'-phosphodiesterase